MVRALLFALSLGVCGFAWASDEGGGGGIGGGSSGGPSGGGGGSSGGPSGGGGGSGGAPSGGSNVSPGSHGAPEAGAIPEAEIACTNGHQVLRLTFEDGVLGSDSSFTGWIGNDVGSKSVTFKRTSSTSIEAQVDKALLKSFQLGYTVDALDTSGTMSLSDPKPERCPSH